MDWVIFRALIDKKNPIQCFDESIHQLLFNFIIFDAKDCSVNSVHYSRVATRALFKKKFFLEQIHKLVKSANRTCD